jgi:phage N-6-adenine-methyltransferase
MNKIIPVEQGALTQFEPERHRLNVAALNYGIEEAKRLKDWPALEAAIDAKIAEQHQFVAWWKVSVPDKGGRPAQTSPRTRTSLSASEAEDITGMSKQRVSDLATRLTKPDKYRDKLLGAEYRAAMLEVIDNVRGTAGTGENEWYTPDEYLEAAHDVLGGFDLDPASSDKAQEKVQARRYYTTKQDGLKLEWVGRVWLNPPYAQPLIAQFVSKMITERLAKRVTAGIMLTHNYTDTAWFHEAAACADAICFTRGRIKFYDDAGTIAAPTQGQAFFYFGDDVLAFADRFKLVGFIVTPYTGEIP